MVSRDPATTGGAIVVILGAATALWKKLVSVGPIVFKVQDVECQKQLAEMRARLDDMERKLTVALVENADLRGTVNLLKQQNNRQHPKENQ